MLSRSSPGESGFALIDVIVVVGLIAVVSAITIPSMTNAINAMRLGQSTRDVERELQTAKQRAVGKGRPMRVRFNCPATGEFRMVELIGQPAVPASADAPNLATRCDQTAYRYPANDDDPITRPNLDGPLRWLDESVSFTAAQTIEFWPDGTAHYDTGAGNPWPMIPTAGISISLTRESTTSTITVNGLGKIQLQQR